MTVIVNVCAAPAQPFAVGVTVIVPVRGAVVALPPRNDRMFPVPLAPNPIFVFVFVQEYAVPETDPEKIISVVLPALHTV